MAAGVCMLSSIATINMYQRARVNKARSRLFWTLATGLVCGCGVWSTHFIGMLAYSPGVPVMFDLAMTMVSLAVAIVMMTAGCVTAIYGERTSTSLIGGAIVGLAISVMHYLGIASLRMSADIVWMPDLLVVSTACGIGFGMLAFFVVRRGVAFAHGGVAALLLAAGTLSDHIIAVSAMGLIPDINTITDEGSLSPITLSVSVASMMLAIVIACLIGAVSDRRSRRHMSERNIQLNAAIQNIMQGLCMFGPDNCLQLWNDKYVSMYKIAPENIRVGASVEELFAARKKAGTIVKELDFYATRLWDSVKNRESARWMLELVDGRTICVA